MPTRLPMPPSPEAESLIARFEAAWLAGTRPDPAAALADCPTADRPAVLRELVHADLEFRLKAAEAARVEEYLARFPELATDRGAMAGLLAAEVEFRARLGDVATPAEVQGRFLGLGLSTLLPADPNLGSAETQKVRNGSGGRAEGVSILPEGTAHGASAFEIGGEIGRGGMGWCTPPGTRCSTGRWRSR